MRIGIVSGEYPPMVGGVGACSQILARRLRDCGHELHLFSDSRAHSADVPLSGTATAWNLRTMFALRRWTRQQRLDVVNLQFQTAAFSMSPWIHSLPRFLGSLPLVTTFHDLRVPWLFPKAGILRQQVVWWLARHSAAVICTNHEDCSSLRGRVRSCRMVPIGSNIPDAQPQGFDRNSWRKNAGLDEDDVLLAWFGLVNHSKGLELLLNSLAGMCAEGMAVRLVLIGGEAGDSDDSNVAAQGRLEQLLARPVLKDRVERSGFLPEAQVSAWLRASDLVILPYLDGASFRRGSLMAAICHDRAILTTTPAVGIPEFVHGENLWLVPAGDAGALEDALKHLVSSPAVREKLGAGARRLAARFDWPAIARDYVACFEQVLERKW